MFGDIPSIQPQEICPTNSSRHTTNMSTCQTFSLPDAPATHHINGTIYCWDFQTNTSFWLHAHDYTCAFFHNCYCPELRHDVEVAGIGVICAFVVTSGLTIISTILSLLLTRTEGQIRPDGTFPHPKRPEPDTLNIIDAFSRVTICRPVVSHLQQKCHFNIRLLTSVVSDLVHFLSDTQLVTGIAVIVSAVVGLHQGDRHEPMTVYHFDIATDLAWFSSITHLSSLLVLRYQHSLTAKKGPDRVKFPWRMQWWPLKIYVGVRLVLMLLFAALLLYSSWVTGYACWDNKTSCPAKCTLGLPRGGEPQQWMIVYWVLIWYGYTRHVLSLSVTIRAFWLEHVRRFVVPHKPVSLRKIGCGKKTVVNLFKTVFFWVWNIFSSDMFDVFELILWFAIGCYGMIDTRHDGHRVMSEAEAEAEDRIGFGQLVPIVLLLSSPLAVIESYARHFKAQRAEKMKEVECKCGGCRFHGC
ncbi:hypothetical protein QBC38DRAFT_482560 [Podospora fimiseda]|uniref:Uncharacterized protein n=1 Tax=Podospora fimiseda TaxID=252190 RepID=A0AAN7BLQ0_9PEZI|nr:hypothetical protein QBC38DRAFT_482560 [Podospora fimiseda]